MQKTISLALVKVSVADLRKKPSEGKCRDGQDLIQESQLVFGERVYVHQELEDWLQVSCDEQYRFSKQEGWHRYPGWIQKLQIVEVESFPLNNIIVFDLWADLYQDAKINSQRMNAIPVGSCLEGEQIQGWWKLKLPDQQTGFVQAHSVQILDSIRKKSENELRTGILAVGRKFLRTPYLWGGRSSYLSDFQCFTGVDCSGLVNLLYRIHGMTIPRDAHDQFLKSQPKDSKDLKLGDLVFISPIKPESRMSHVMLYSGGDNLLESAMQPKCVREISCTERFGRPLRAIEHGQQIGDLRLWFGSLLDNEVKSSAQIK